MQLAHNMPDYSVSEISAALKRVVEDQFSHVRVRGEISGWKIHSSGHAYFSLKDDKSVLNSVCWKGTAGKLNFKPEDGLEVICVGRISTYGARSNYQLVVEHMEPAGVGALMALLEKRKALLAAEGLFDEKRKKPLPFLPQRIGVVTSPTGAVIRDILHRLADRFPRHVLLWPVAVQGEGAAEQVAAAIGGFNALDISMRPDVLIVARGGGSIEDLWAFNEEIVVRAAAASQIPLISAVGHETDTTLIDYVSSRRAPTPTAAAEICVPVLVELRMIAAQLEQRAQAGMYRQMQTYRDKLEALARALPHPRRMLETVTQRLDEWAERLHAALPAMLARKQQQLQILSAQLRPVALQKEMELKSKALAQLSDALQQRMMRIVEQKQHRFASITALLGSLSYENVLSRGFALVRGSNGALVTSANAAAQEVQLTVQFKDGQLAVVPK